MAPKVSVLETYTDNVFLAHNGTQEDFITSIAPGIRLDLAFAPKNILSLGYEGRYSFYANFDNLERNTHKPHFSWTLIQPKGSKLVIGVSELDSSFLPDSEEDEPNDFDLTTYFLDSSIKLGAFTESNFKFNHELRRFDRKADAGDEYDKNDFTLNFVYNGFDFTSPLIEYRCVKQNSNDQVEPSTDFDSHTFLGGLQWKPPRRLSGDLKLGYTHSNFEEIRDFNGYVFDINLLYEISSFTQLNLISLRRIERSTQAARETENYFVSTGTGLSLNYSKFHLLKIALNLFYTNKDYENEGSVGKNREDNIYDLDLRIMYVLEEWLFLSMEYSYNRNDSNLMSEDYKENRFTLGLTASLF